MGLCNPLIPGTSEKYCKDSGNRGKIKSFRQDAERIDNSSGSYKFRSVAHWGKFFS